MGKGNDPNCTSAAAPMAALTPEEMAAAAQAQRDQARARQAVRAARQLAIIERRVTSGARSGAGRTVTDGRSAYKKMVDDHAVLYGYEKAVTTVMRYHPEERWRDRARNLLWLCNQRMAMLQADQHFKVWGRHGFTYDDCLAAANEGLEAAMAKYDPFNAENSAKHENEAMFMTYAKPWVRMKLNRLVENNSERIYGVRVPTELFWEIFKVRNVSKTVHEAGGDTSPEALADHPDLKSFWTHKKGGKTRKLSREQVVARVARCLDIERGRSVSLNESLRTGDEGSAERGDLMADFSADTAEEGIAAAEASHISDIAREVLDEREWKVLGSLYLHEFIDDPAFTPADTANQLGSMWSMRAQTIRDIEANARQKLIEALQGSGYTAVSA